MERRSLIKGALLTAAAVPAASVLGATSEAGAQEPQGIGKVDIKPVSPDYFIPKRFQGRTIIVTGFARGMGKPPQFALPAKAPTWLVSIGFRKKRRRPPRVSKRKADTLPFSWAMSPNPATASAGRACGHQVRRLRVGDQQRRSHGRSVFRRCVRLCQTEVLAVCACARSQR